MSPTSDFGPAENGPDDLRRAVRSRARFRPAKRAIASHAGVGSSAMPKRMPERELVSYKQRFATKRQYGTNSNDWLLPSASATSFLNLMATRSLPER